jgi:hypothetical protein
MQGLFGNLQPEIPEKKGCHVQKTEVFSPVVGKHQAEKKLEAVISFDFLMQNHFLAIELIYHD